MCVTVMRMPVAGKQTNCSSSLDRNMHIRTLPITHEYQLRMQYLLRDQSRVSRYKMLGALPCVPRSRTAFRLRRLIEKNDTET